MEKEQTKCLAILKASQVSINELPEEIQEKIQVLNAVIESKKSIDVTDDRELRDWALKVDARDNAVLADLEGYIAKRKREQLEKQQQQPQDKEPQNKPQRMAWGGRIIIENKPKWMFW
jgi:hypothetical protein